MGLLGPRQAGEQKEKRRKNRRGSKEEAELRQGREVPPTPALYPDPTPLPQRAPAFPKTGHAMKNRRGFRGPGSGQARPQ